MQPAAATPRWLSAGAFAWIVAAAAAGCTNHSNPPTPSLSPSAPVSLSARQPSAPASSSPPAAVLPSGCPQLLPLGTLEQILGVGLLGQVTYLKAAPVPQSGRTGRVTCGYGTPVSTPSATGSVSPTPTASGTPLVEVSYITYVDAKTAAGRVALTVQADGASATVTKVQVGEKPAVVLLGKQSSELLMADGARTIVVVASSTVLPVAKAPAALEAIAADVLKFGAPAVAASPSAGASS